MKSITHLFLHGLIPVIILGLSISSCATYHRVPLDMNAYSREWEERSPQSQSVIEFARLMEDQGDGRAKHYDPSDGLQRFEAEIIALHFNPGLGASRQKALVEVEGVPYSGLWDDPVLSADAARIFESVEHQWLGGFSLDLTLPVSGRLALQKKKASSKAHAALLEVAVNETGLVRQLRESWLTWSALLQKIELYQLFLSEIERIDSIAQTLMRAGELSRVQARVFSIERAGALYEIQKLKRKAGQEEIRLKAILGFVPEAPIQMTPSLEIHLDSNLLPNWRELLIERNLLLALRRAHYDLSEKALELEIRKQYPDITLGTGFESEEGDPRLGFGVSLPIPLLNRNQKAIAEAYAMRNAERAAWNAEYENLVSGCELAQLRLRESQELHAYLTGQLAPLIDRQTEEQHRLAQLGELDVLLFLDAIKSAHKTKLDILDAQCGEALAKIEILSFFERGVPMERDNAE